MPANRLTATLWQWSACQNSSPPTCFHQKTIIVTHSVLDYGLWVSRHELKLICLICTNVSLYAQMLLQIWVPKYCSVTFQSSWLKGNKVIAGNICTSNGVNKIKATEYSTHFFINVWSSAVTYSVLLHLIPEFTDRTTLSLNLHPSELKWT